MKITERCNCGESVEYAPDDVGDEGIKGWRETHFESCGYGHDTTHDSIQSAANALHGLREELHEVVRLLNSICSALETR